MPSNRAISLPDGWGGGKISQGGDRQEVRYKKRKDLLTRFYHSRRMIEIPRTYMYLLNLAQNDWDNLQSRHLEVLVPSSRTCCHMHRYPIVQAQSRVSEGLRK